MKNQITIREAVTDKDIALFWEELRCYFKRDIFPEPEDEDREYFLGEDYREQIQVLHDRNVDRCSYILFSKNGIDIGFALPALYLSEDGKCFIMEFCVFPEYRGFGTGRECARALMDWTRERGAKYWELNSGGNERRERFWKSLGFVPNGADEWGEPLMLLPPKEEVPVTVALLSKADDWQLMKLENGFLAEIGEESLDEEKQKRMSDAIAQGKISFFLAKRGARAVGMCSVSPYWSTFSCGETAVFEDFYIEPVFRGKGIARLLANAAQSYCAHKGFASLSVCCADCDRDMYKALGFETRLGNTLTFIT